MLGIGLRIWDIAAGVVIAREAGLAVKLWERANAFGPRDRGQRR